MNGKRQMIKELTNSAVSILAKYENDEKSGLLTREEAQKTAISRIQYLRYGDENKDYFWITDMHPRMIMHPYRSDLNGKDLTNFSDPNGKKLFVEFVKAVETEEHGYVDYMWQWKDDTTHIVPKLSYVSRFKPWNWIIGTGIYIEDVKHEIGILTRKLILISLIITFIISVLLLFVTQQSYRIEKKRRQAESELQKSQEKYRALVEASTEGLIFAQDGKINYINAAITNILGYNETELWGKDFKSLLAPANNKDVFKDFSREQFPESRKELFFIDKNNNTKECLTEISALDLSGKKSNVIIIKDISLDQQQQNSDTSFRNIFQKMDIGLLRFPADMRERVLAANSKALTMLGFSNLHELQNTSLEKLIRDDNTLSEIRRTLASEGFIKNKIITLYTKEDKPKVVRFSMVVFKNENNQLICEASLEDFTEENFFRTELQNQIKILSANQSLLYSDIKNFIRPVSFIDSNASISDAIEKFKRNSEAILVKDNQNNIIGIITNKDLKQRVLFTELDTANPVGLIMSSPVRYLPDTARIIDLLDLCYTDNIHHPVIRTQDSQILGTVCSHEIEKNCCQNLDFIRHEIKKANSVEQLRKLKEKADFHIRIISACNTELSALTNNISSLSDSITQRLISIFIEENGQPPCDFAFIALGSEGRKEPSLFADQDNAIIIENLDKENSTIKEYFLQLSAFVCDNLDSIGYRFCKGNVMAKNEKWCVSLKTWEKYFSNWINEPEPQNLLDALIFFDFRTVYGSDELTKQLRDFIFQKSGKSGIFHFYLAKTISEFNHPAVSSGTLQSLDLKMLAVPFVMFARLYSLKNFIPETNTLLRLEEIHRKREISDEFYKEFLFIYSFILNTRIKSQIRYINKREEIKNLLYPGLLSETEINILKRSHNLYQTIDTKLKTDFRTSV